MFGMPSYVCLLAPLNILTRNNRSVMLAKRVIVFLLIFCSSSEPANADNQFITYWQPSFNFAISIPKGWAIDVKDTDNGRTFVFHDRKGSAFSISITGPTESKMKLSKHINEKGFSELELQQLARLFERETGYKQDVVISVETISNRKAFTQSFFYSHNTLGNISYSKYINFELIHKNKVYLIDFAGSAARTKREAVMSYNAALNKYFSKMLPTLVLYP